MTSANSTTTTCVSYASFKCLCPLVRYRWLLIASLCESVRSVKVLLSWMQEFAPITGEPEEIARQLTDLGMVVEETSVVGASLDGVVVAKVLELAPHPQADRIQLVQVDAGDGEPLQICCGAFNMSVGDLVPLATIGMTMPNGMEIAQRKMRGELSNGMLCAASEIDLPETDYDGILILDSSLNVGQPLGEALNQKSDVLFDLDIEGNRPDALSIVGVARDLAARLNVPFTQRSPEFDESSETTETVASVTIEDPVFCPRFGVRVLRDVQVGESPDWMQQRLDAAGMRPINAIVDISNYVMLELGQPNHSYDLDKVPDGSLVVRRATQNEELVTLDDTKRSLIEADGVISNIAGEAIGLAGVMGGQSTEISTETTNVVVEAAVWDRMPIAWTARRLNLRSEASTRFERGVDPLGIERALDRFAELAVEICGATVLADTIIAEGAFNPTEAVLVRLERINLILNLDLDASTVVSILEPIGFSAVDNTDGTLSVSIPTWRPDASIEEDIIEEIGRHYGYQASGVRVPTPTQAGELSAAQRSRRKLRRAFLTNGYSEAMPLPFIAQSDLEHIGSSAEAISISHPLVAEESLLRPTMMPGLLKAVAYNQTHRIDAVQLFEVGKVFLPGGEDLPEEPEIVAAVASGYSPSDKAAEQAVKLIYDVAARLGLTGLTIKNDSVEGLHPNRSASVTFRGRVIGAVGEVDPGVSEQFGIAGRVAWLELRTETILAAMASTPKYTPISRFPSSDVDLAFVTSTDVSAVDVARTIKKAGDGVVQSVELFDVFRSDELGHDVRSLAYNLRLQASDRTLKEAEVADIRNACIEAVSKAHNAELR